MRKIVDAALGRVPCDLIVKNVRYLDVFTCTWKTGDVAVYDGTIVGLESGLKAKQVNDGKGRALVPGFIDAHVHLESSLMLPGNFQNTVLPRGTTTAICDPHELANVLGISGIQYFLDAAETLDLDLRVMLSSCVPATTMETNGGGTLGSRALRPLMSHPKALGLAEMMNVPGVLNGDTEIFEKLDLFSAHPIDGHCPLLTGRELSAYAATGISSCHESSRLDEALEKISKGMSVWIREGSVAKDLNALIPALTLATSGSIGFCTDDRNPLDIANEGHIDHLVRTAITRGVAPEVVFRSSSLSVARHYGLKKLGAIAPGYNADFVLLEDVGSCAIADVYKSGKVARELSATSKSADSRNTIHAVRPAVSDLIGPAGRVNVIGVQEGRILTEHHVMNHDEKGVARLSVLERHGKGSKPANAYVTGFGLNFKGAIASSVGHDSHNLIVAGDTAANMLTALSALIDCGGGFCVVRNGMVVAKLELPFGGLMSNADPKEIERSLRELHKASHSIGCELSEPFLQLAFLSLPVIPKLKLTDKGLIDVVQFKVIDVRAS